MYVYIVHRCAWVFISVWERLCVQVRILTCGRSMCGHSGLMLSFSPLLFHLINGGKGSLSDSELTDRASFPRQLALGSLCFDFLRLKLTGDSVHPQHLCGSCRSELFFCLYGKCFNHWAVSPPSLSFMVENRKTGYDLIPKDHLQGLNIIFFW